MTMCLLFPVGMLVMAVVDEKEHRLKQTLKISGLTHASWAGGWYATALLQFFLIALLCAGTTASFMIHRSRGSPSFHMMTRAAFPLVW